MKLSCLLFGHEWLLPSWESYELWERCSRCLTRRIVVSIDRFFAHLGSRFLIALPTSIAVLLLEDKLLKNRDRDFARAWLTGMGLYGDQENEETVQPETIPEAWLPWIQFALTELVQGTKLRSARIETFFSSFARKAALPFLLDMANNRFCLLGEQIEEKIIETKELSLECRKQFMHGNWQSATECADMVVNTYKVETVHAQYWLTRPIASGAQRALRMLRDKDPALQPAIALALFATAAPLPVEREFTRKVLVEGRNTQVLRHS